MRFNMATLQDIKDLLPSNANGSITAAVLRQAFEEMWNASVAGNAPADGDIAIFDALDQITGSDENLASLILTLNNKQDALPTVLVDITANRPLAPIVGQLFLDTTLAAAGKPIWHKGGNVWVDATGTIV